MMSRLSKCLTLLVASSALVAPVAAEAKKKPVAPPPAPVAPAPYSAFFTNPMGPAAAQRLIERLRESAVDGFAGGPALVPQVEAAIAAGQAGDAWAKANADQVIGGALAAYVATFHQLLPGVDYGDPSMKPRVPSQALLLALVAGASDPVAMIDTLTTPNPLYGAMRAKLVEQAKATGALPKAALDSLARLRPLPAKGRFILVDAVSARLWLYNDGKLEDTMRLVVGKNQVTPVNMQTPMAISRITYGTYNPYWHVPDHLARKNIAARHLAAPKTYLKSKGYEVVADWDGPALDPTTVDWKAVQAGKKSVLVRQLPGKENFMGKMKFNFPNASGVYLHDTPELHLMKQDDRHISNGCIRLEDAQRFNNWVWRGAAPDLATMGPETHVKLPSAIPVYAMYLPVQVQDGALIQLADVYNRDSLVPVPIALAAHAATGNASGPSSTAGSAN